jgi:hypothetical protein
VQTIRKKMGRSSLRTRGPNNLSDSFGYHHTDWWRVLAVTDVTIDCGKLNDGIARPIPILGESSSFFGTKKPNNPVVGADCGALGWASGKIFIPYESGPPTPKSPRKSRS